MAGSSPSVDKAYAIAKILEVSVEELVTGKEPETVEVYDEDERQQVKKLLRILRTKQYKTVSAIRQNLDAFLDNPEKEKRIPHAAEETLPYGGKRGKKNNT